MLLTISEWFVNNAKYLHDFPYGVFLLASILLLSRFSQVVLLLFPLVSYSFLFVSEEM
jgi:hypothetical protein